MLQIYSAQSGHPGGAFSCADILTVLCFSEMNVDIYETIEHFAELNRISYVHLRNVKGKVVFRLFPNFGKVK